MRPQNELWLVDADRLRRLRVRLSQLAERAHQVLAEAEVVAQELGKVETEIANELGYIPLANLNRSFLNGTFAHGVPEERFEIGRYSYAEVVDRLVPDPLFSLDEAWEAIRDRIVTDTDRVRDGLRQSLDRDERFERIDAPDGGIWYTRVDRTQGRMLLDADEAMVYTDNGR